EGVTAKVLPHYSENVSTRAHPDEDADIWSTEKTGIQVGKIAIIHAALENWATGASLTATVDYLVGKGHSEDYAKEVVDTLDRIFLLWSRFGTEAPLRLDAVIERKRVESLSTWATKPSEREHKEPDDPFRGHYQRDRDRILWSSGLRRLSNKTQLF